MVGAAGFEPTLTESESGVLPLNYAPMCGLLYIVSGAFAIYFFSRDNGKIFLFIFIAIVGNCDTVKEQKGFVYLNKGESMSAYKRLTDLVRICSVLPALAIMPAFADDGAPFTLTDGYVFQNQSQGAVGAGDPAYENAGGLTITYGANLPADGIVNNVSFINNSSVYSGGAMKALNGFTAGDGWKFKDNTSEKISGGLYIKLLETLKGQPIQNLNREVVIGDNWEFSGNKSAWLGGALGIEAAATVTIGDGAVFEDNSSDTDGGAVAVWTDSNDGDVTRGTTVNFGSVEFSGNTAGNRGGALANLNNDESPTSFVNTVNIGAGSLFTENSANMGGAIYNMGTMSVSGVFDDNDADTRGGAIHNMGNMTVTRDALFTDNEANFGGAIWNEGTLSFADGTTRIVFAGNDALAGNSGGGGAIYNKGHIDEISHMLFQGNSGYNGGAINNGVNEGKAGTVGAIKNSTFVNNSGGNGGAVRNQNIINTIDTVYFQGNVANSGGAFWNGTLGSVVDSMTNVSFIQNAATGGNQQGGAINNAGKITVLSDSSFTGNQAGKIGGAIANVNPSTGGDTSARAIINLSDVTFDSNVAGVSGGAIYNDVRGDITLSGNNSFANNYANGKLNDIHNLGTLAVSGGVTKLSGGITGDTGALTIANGATLDIGTSAITQQSVTIDGGTLAASLLNSSNYGKVSADTITAESGTLKLNIGGAGTYKIFVGDDVNVDGLTVDAGSVYNVTNNGADGIVVATKSVADIAKDTGLSNQGAANIAALANSQNAAVNTISLRAQQELAAGNVDYVESETAKLNPDNKPVAQSVASSVQNQVMALAAGRMSGGSVGRSGGDAANIDYGIWAQGLYNRSKYNGKFTGDTTGISVGADALIDGKYTLGIGYAYNSTDVDANSRDTSIDSSSLFVYGQYKPSQWFVNAALNYTMADYTENATAFQYSVQAAEYDVDSFGGQVMTGYDFASGLTPEVGARYLHISQDSYESVLGRVEAADTDYLTGVAGLRYTFDVAMDRETVIRPELRAAATYDFVSDAAVATVVAPGNVSYVIDADRLSRFGGEFGIGVTAEYRGLEISLNYDLDLHEDYTSQTGMLKFRYDF